MYGLGQPPPSAKHPPHPAALPGPMNPSYQPNSVPGYPATTPTGEGLGTIPGQAYASNAASPRGTPPTIGFTPSMYAQQSAAAAAYGYGAPTYHAGSGYPYSAVYSSASVQSPYNTSCYTQSGATPAAAAAYSASSLSSAYAQQVQQGMVPTMAMIQGVPRPVYVTDTRPSVMSAPTTAQHAAAAAAAANTQAAAYYQSPAWQQQQQQAAAQPHRTFNPNPYGHHW